MPNKKDDTNKRLKKVAGGMLDMDDNHDVIISAKKFKKHQEFMSHFDESSNSINADVSSNAILVREPGTSLDKEYASEKALLSSLINQITHKTNIKILERELDHVRQEKEL
eukprot:CAMPEP_0176340834 /NCGR_PEP_ID=MMETSP0126-20121128/1876_1 /TAXON_ID=141414 ORGANISM="Strombidinopsis acuminatum, Strain SPMC142" /NCGR_SAMPLE_ID=MMETSP0126 /ASSEMBLY_ACC=CAM_ASM_000229 /LENGTH=110 /DNA_ID=CAMNT_0017685251 /DNA_START=421 /DNA_END=753 /DNA_ORIENTATION=-